MSERGSLPMQPTEAQEDALWTQVVQASSALEASKRLLVAAQEDRSADHAAAASQVRLARAAFDAVFSEWQELRREIRQSRRMAATVDRASETTPDTPDAPPEADGL